MSRYRGSSAGQWSERSDIGLWTDRQRQGEEDGAGLAETGMGDLDWRGPGRLLMRQASVLLVLPGISRNLQSVYASPSLPASQCYITDILPSQTFTMTGDPHSYRNRGIVPRAVAHVFQHIASKPESEFSVSISYMEVYGEKIRDLLVVAGATNGVAPGTAAALGITVNRSGQLMSGTGGHENAVLNPGEFNIVEDPVHGTVVRGLTLVPAASEEEVLNAAFAAELARTTADHALNKNSNRSHCIFTIYIQQRSRLGGGREKIISSKVHLVDLAGSERIKKTMGTGPLGDGAEAELQRESMAINKSLTYLEQCVVALSSRSRTHVPYKNSMLTKVLRDALGGNCATLLIACVWGEARHLEETISTLRFAQRMMAVQNEVTEQHYIDADAMLKKLTREVAQLKQELQMHGGYHASFMV